MGPQRSIAKAAKALGKPTQQLEAWSRRHNWTARVAAYAAHLAQVERQAAEALALA